MKKRLLALLLTVTGLIGLILPASAAVPEIRTVIAGLEAPQYRYALPEDSQWEFAVPDYAGRLTISEGGGTATLFAPGVSPDGGWRDTNKHWDGRDNALCWAAACSNLIDWYLGTGEALGMDLTGLRRNHMDIFDNQFRGIWEPEEGFDMNNGLSWYFTGRFTNAPDDPAFNPPTLSDPDRHMMLTRHPGGFLGQLPHVGTAFLGLYPEILYPDRYETMRTYVGDGDTKYPFGEVLDGLYGTAGNLSTLKSFSDSILRALKYGAVGLTVKQETALGSSHAVTLWGADFDPETGLIRHLYITDSDDYASQLRKITVKARTPDADGIYLTDFYYNGGKWTRISDAQVLFAWGAVREKVKPLQITGVNMTLGNDLAMNFFISQAEVPDPAGLSVRITKTFADARDPVTVTVPAARWQTYNDRYMVTFRDISAKEMTDTVQAVVLRDGQPAGPVYTDSAADYALRVLRREGTAAELKAVIVDMLNYGAQAQKHFHYSEAVLANAQLTAREQALASAPVTGEDVRVKGEKYFGANLNLGSNMALTLYFKGITPDMHAVISYTGHTGQKREIPVAGSDFVRYNETVYGIRANTLVVADARQPVTVTVYDAAGHVVGSGVDSIASYVERSSTVGELGQAILKFSASAKIYFANR